VADSALAQVETLLDRIVGHGNGLRLETEVDLPKGSGLGTSSILILACLQALRRLFRPADSSAAELNREFNMVLAVEQLLTTGGGWQDQIGGGAAGLKYIETAPGLVPEYRIEEIQLSSDHVRFFNDKLLVVYTGRTRMAKAILTNVVENWYLRKKQTVQSLAEISHRATEMHAMWQEFARRPPHECEQLFDRLGEALQRFRFLNISLEKSVTNPHLEELFATVAPFVSGSQIIGAGSGGFVLGFLRTGVTKAQVNQKLQEKHAADGVEIADMTICMELM
jgi:fucokinase